eukprot:5081565-Heterocapsa_arctica.AAC.1
MPEARPSRSKESSRVRNTASTLDATVPTLSAKARMMFIGIGRCSSRSLKKGSKASTNKEPLAEQPWRMPLRMENPSKWPPFKTMSQKLSL